MNYHYSNYYNSFLLHFLLSCCCCLRNIITGLLMQYVILYLLLFFFFNFNLLLHIFSPFFNCFLINAMWLAHIAPLAQRNAVNSFLHLSFIFLLLTKWVQWYTRIYTRIYDACMCYVCTIVCIVYCWWLTHLMMRLMTNQDVTMVVYYDELTQRNREVVEPIILYEQYNKYRNLQKFAVIAVHPVYSYMHKHIDCIFAISNAYFQGWVRCIQFACNDTITNFSITVWILVSTARQYAL